MLYFEEELLLLRLLARDCFSHGGAGNGENNEVICSRLALEQVFNNYLLPLIFPHHFMVNHRIVELSKSYDALELVDSRLVLRPEINTDSY